MPLTRSGHHDAPMADTPARASVSTNHATVMVALDSASDEDSSRHFLQEHTHSFASQAPHALSSSIWFKSPRAGPKITQFKLRRNRYRDAGGGRPQAAAAPDSDHNASASSSGSRPGRCRRGPGQRHSVASALPGCGHCQTDSDRRRRRPGRFRRRSQPQAESRRSQ